MPAFTAGREEPSNGSQLCHPQPDGDRSPSDHTDGVGTKEPSLHAICTRKRERDGETRIPFERMVATRKWFDTPCFRVARERDLFVAEFLGVENVRGSTGTSGFCWYLLVSYGVLLPIP